MDKKLITTLVIIFSITAIISTVIITSPNWFPNFIGTYKDNISQQSNSDSINVDKNLLTVDITLPKELFADMPISTKITEEDKANGITAKKINADSSVTYTFIKSKWQETMKEYKNEVMKGIEDIVKGSEYPSIKQVKYQNDFREITVIVDKNKWDSSYDSFACMEIYMSVGFYQCFNQQEPGCVFTIVDISTKKIIEQITYPE